MNFNMLSKTHKIFFAIAVVILIIVGGTLQYYFNPPYIILYITAINLCAVILYLYDKIISRTGKGRVPEMVLHTIALIGGSLGALFAAIVLQHKTAKQSFMLITWAILLVQALIIGFLTYKEIIF